MRDKSLLVVVARRRAPGKSLRCQGVSLIEVLVAVLVLSVGIVGLAGLQASALQANQVAFQHTQATALAGDIIDRMRANRDAALEGDYDTAFADPVDCAVPNVSGTGAEQDLLEWRTALGCALPGGQGRIVRSGNEATVTVRWLDRDDENGEAPHEFVLRGGI